MSPKSVEFILAVDRGQIPNNNPLADIPMEVCMDCSHFN